MVNKVIRCPVCGKDNIHVDEITCSNQTICDDCCESGYFYCERKQKICHVSLKQDDNSECEFCNNTRKNSTIGYNIYCPEL